MRVYSAGEFEGARQLFQTLATHASKRRLYRAAAMNWNNAGACSLALMQYGRALHDFTQAKEIAEQAGLREALADTGNNIAALYLQMGQPENALQVATAGLRAASDFPEARAKLRFQSAYALTQLARFDEAKPAYLLSINELIDQDRLDAASRELGLFGKELVRGNRLVEADWALCEAFRLTSFHHLQGSANILRGLAQLRNAQGDLPSAAILFDAALAAPHSITPRWSIFMDRGNFRLRRGDLHGALGDFRDARRIAINVRAEMVPVDQDRIALDDGRDGLSGVMEGLVDSGNLLATRSTDAKLLRETFDAAEQDRLWSLRALVPNTDDWRSRLPSRYWQLLANYRASERASLSGGQAYEDVKLTPLSLEIHQIEVSAAGLNSPLPSDNVSPLVHVRKVLDRKSVLLSFHITKTSSWVWVVDRLHTAVYPLPSITALSDQVARFSHAVQGGTSSDELGHVIYQELFGKAARSLLAHEHWLLEPDGPLYQLPFAALVTGHNATGQPEYLVEHSTLQLVPSALLMERGTFLSNRGFLGIGDPIYNAADARYAASAKPQRALARLPNTATELDACARQWTFGKAILLKGSDANLDQVRSAMQTNPSVIHFATHIVSSSGEYGSGLIALSLNFAGTMEFLGPREIVAQPVAPCLVIMDGCHSSQGDALPTSGLMGLTRAWIGAGARAVLATQWDVQDGEAQTLMTGFYRALNRFPEAPLAAALQQAQLEELHREGGRNSPRRWAGYFLLSRI